MKHLLILGSAAALVIAVGLMIGGLVRTVEASGVPAQLSVQTERRETSAATQLSVSTQLYAKEQRAKNATDIPRAPIQSMDRAAIQLFEYAVQSGDTLTDIAKAQYGITDGHDAYVRALVIWDANRDPIGPDPDYILPGQVLLLPIGDQLTTQVQDSGNGALTSQAAQVPSVPGVGSTPTRGVGDPNKQVQGDAGGDAKSGSSGVKDSSANSASPSFEGDSRTSAPANGHGLFEPSAQRDSVLAIVIGLAAFFSIWFWLQRHQLREVAPGSGHAGTQPVLSPKWPSGTTVANLAGTGRAGRSITADRAIPYPGGNGLPLEICESAEGEAIRPLVLLAGEDLSEAASIGRQLAQQAYAVVLSGLGRELLTYCTESRPDVVLISESTEDDSGLPLVPKLRRNSTVPVLVLIRGDNPQHRVRALRLGADDCISKPVDLAELGARIDAVLRRKNGRPKLHQPMQVRDLEIDLIYGTVRQNGKLVRLTVTEWELLRCLALNAGRVVAKEELLVSVWGPEYQDAEAYLRVWIPRLRKRLGSREAADAIKTINGIGYVLDVC